MITPLLDPTLIVATSGLIALVVIAAAMLRAWQGWLELKREELGRTPSRPDEGPGFGTGRIEIADLKERIRKLEAIASGVEL